MNKIKIKKNTLAKHSVISKALIFTSGICIGFFQTVIFISDSCAQSAPPQATGPIDIQANEQEFGENVVLAKGDVTVTYKDSVVKGPEAKLYRDSAGQPQKAVFVGHPHLVQNDSKISADTLVFEIANSKFIAEGNAHSEVVSAGNDTQVDMKATPGQKKDDFKSTKAETVSGNKVASASKGSANSKQPFAWPQASDDQNANRVKPSVNSNGQTASSTNTVKKPNTSKPGQAEPEVEKIITDSDYQEYEKDSGKFDASGHVHVIHGAVSVFADKLKLVYGTDSKPETALFTGNVNALQDGNNTQAEKVTYYLKTRRLQATGNVKSRMIQQKPLETPNSKTAANKKVISAKPNAGGATAAPSVASAIGDDGSIIVVSDSQDMNQNTGKMSAEGNVRVYYQDIIGVGPKALLLRNADGRAEKVIFTERSQISQPGKRWIADRITMAVATKKILAEGNTKALIIQGSPGGQKSSPQSSGALAMHANRGGPKIAPASIASDRPASGIAIGSSKIETIR